MGRNNGDFRTEYDKDSQTFMTPAAKQAKDGWVSPWPQGHPNRTEYQSPAQQTRNAKVVDSHRAAGKPNPFITGA